MSQWYRVTLRPLQSLLLGGYHTHGRVDVDPIRSPVYFSKSLMLPQQTTVWGMFRKYLLDVYGLLKTDWNYSSEDRKRSSPYFCVNSPSVRMPPRGSGRLR